DNSRYFSFKKYKVGSIIIKNKSENYNISLAFQNDGIINNIIKEAELTIGFNDCLFERKFEDTSFPYFYYEDNDYEYIISLVTRESGMDNSNFFNTENKIQKEYVLKILKKNSANAFSLEQDEKYQSYLQFYFFQ
nr:hypothetical protein [Treponema sp.]